MTGIFRRWPFGVLAGAAVTGIVLAENLELPGAAALTVALVLGAGAVLVKNVWGNFVVVIAAFLAGHTLHHFGNPARSLAQLHRAGPKVVHGSGMISSPPVVFSGTSQSIESSFQLDLLTLEESPTDPAGVRVMASWRGGQPEMGDMVEFTGSLRDVEDARNPGQFDFGGYRQRQGVYSDLVMPYPSALTRSGYRRPAWWRRATLATRSWMQQVLTVGLADAPDVSAVIRSMTLGSKSEIPDELRRHFEQTGTLHIFVVSGLHVGLLGAIVFWLLTVAGLSPRTAALVLGPLLWCYAALADFSPGSVRATVMGSVVLAGLICRRPPLTWNCYFAAVFLLLMWDTEQLFQPGFQFSFGVVAAILLLAGPVHRRLKPLVQPDAFLPRGLWRWDQRWRTALLVRVAALMAASVAAWVGSLFFTAKFFHLISPSAVLANLIVVPMAGLILGEAILALLAGGFSATLAGIFNNANWLLVKSLLAGVALFARMPGGHVYVAWPTWEKRADTEIVALDLGAGAATAVWADGQVWLVDCGNENAYRGIVRPFLRSRGVNRLDGFIVTHGDTRHIGGALDLLADFRPRRVLTGEVNARSPASIRLGKELEPRSSEVRRVQAGDSIPFGKGGSWKVLSPVAGGRGRLADDESLVLQLRTRGHRILFTSDIGFSVEQRLLAEPELASDVLIKGMHRADYSGTPALMRKIRARCVIVADYAPFGEMPTTPLTAVAVADAGGTLLKQSETGAVRVRFVEGDLAWQTFLPAHRFTSRSENTGSPRASKRR